MWYHSVCDYIRGWRVASTDHVTSECRDNSRRISTSVTIYYQYYHFQDTCAVVNLADEHLEHMLCYSSSNIYY